MLKTNDAQVPSPLRNYLFVPTALLVFFYFQNPKCGLRTAGIKRTIVNKLGNVAQW